MQSKRWLVTGASGNLARSIRYFWPYVFPNDELVCLTRDGVYLPDGRAVRGSLDSLPDVDDMLKAIAPDAILHCAALSRPSDAEAQPEAATHLHRDVTKSFAHYLKARGGWLLYCSTDFVFSGTGRQAWTENDAAFPTTFYGASKLAGELTALEHDRALVARLSLMFDPLSGGRDAGWARARAAINRGVEVAGVTDEWRSPIGFAPTALILLLLAKDERSGIVHIGGGKKLTPYELLIKLRDAAGSTSQVIPTQQSSIGAPANRPVDVFLATQKLREWLHGRMPGDFDSHRQCAEQLLVRAM